MKSSFERRSGLHLRFTREISTRARPALDISRARDELSYEPRFDVEAGLADFIKEMGQ